MKEQTTQLPKNHYYVGFLIWEPQMEIPAFLKEPGSPWALITLSSVRQEDWDRDQPGVAARAERLGVAQVVPRAYANPEEVKRAVTTVLDDLQYRKAAAFQSERLEEIDSVAVACRLLEEM